MTHDLSIMPHHESWIDCFMHESSRLKGIFSSNVIRIHHIGSTTVCGLYAKPEMDLHIELKTVSEIDKYDSLMSEIGHTVRGESIDPGRYYYDNYSYCGFGARALKVHASESSSPSLEAHFLFRDLLRIHPTLVREYSELKLRLSRSNVPGIVEYLESKAPFIKKCLEMAAKEIQL